MKRSNTEPVLLTSNDQYRFPVKEIPLYAVDPESGEKYDTKMKSIFRIDTKEVIAEVSNMYKLIEHKDALDRVDEAFDIFGMKYDKQVFMNRGGSRLYAEYNLKDMTSEIDKDDHINYRFIVRNSYDTTMNFTASLEGLRLVCLNGLTAWGSVFGMVTKHIGAAGLMAPNEIVEGMKRTIDHQEKFVTPFWKKLVSVKVSKSVGSDFISTSVEKEVITEKAAEVVLDNWQKAGQENAWLLYNSYTWNNTHNIKAKSYENYLATNARVSTYFRTHFSNAA